MYLTSYPSGSLFPHTSESSLDPLPTDCSPRTAIGKLSKQRYPSPPRVCVYPHLLFFGLFLFSSFLAAGMRKSVVRLIWLFFGCAVLFSPWLGCQVHGDSPRILTRLYSVKLAPLHPFSSAWVPLNVYPGIPPPLTGCSNLSPPVRLPVMLTTKLSLLPGIIMRHGPSYISRVDTSAVSATQFLDLVLV